MARAFPEELRRRTSTRTLAAAKTRTLARPVVLMLSQGFMHAYFQKNPDAAAP